MPVKLKIVGMFLSMDSAPKKNTLEHNRKMAKENSHFSLSLYLTLLLLSQKIISPPPWCIWYHRPCPPLSSHPTSPSGGRTTMAILVFGKRNCMNEGTLLSPCIIVVLVHYQPWLGIPILASNFWEQWSLEFRFQCWNSNNAGQKTLGKSLWKEIKKSEFWWNSVIFFYTIWEIRNGFLAIPE